MQLRELFLKEDDRSTAVFAFGRFNPPTIGHQKLIETVLQTAEKANGKAYLFLSHKQNNKTDPLNFAEKQAYIQQFYPKLAVGDAGANTIIKALQKIQAEGRTRIIMVAGSDRVEEFKKLLNQYNGKPDKQGNDLYNFDDIKVVNAGQRDLGRNRRYLCLAIVRLRCYLYHSFHPTIVRKLHAVRNRLD